MKIRLSDLRRIIKEEVQRTLAEGRESTEVIIKSMYADENDLGKVFIKDDNQQYTYDREATLEDADDLPVEEFDPGNTRDPLEHAYSSAPSSFVPAVFHRSKRY